MKFADEPKPEVPVQVPKGRARRNRVGRSTVRYMLVWTIMATLSFVGDLLDLPEWWRFLARLVD